MTEPRWRAGRVLLIGDAAHACSPIMIQGGAMAFEDALVLSEMLGEAVDAPERWQDVLDTFEARRRPRVEWVREQTHLRIAQATAGPVALAPDMRRPGSWPGSARTTRRSWLRREMTHWVLDLQAVAASGRRKGGVEHDWDDGS